MNGGIKTSSISGIILLAFLLCFRSNIVFAATGSIWTTGTTCAQQDAQDDNEYAFGSLIVIRASGFDPDTTYDWSITGQPASCDPKEVVASGTATTNSEGSACVEAYTVGDDGDDDCGVYKVNFGGKNDNYNAIGTEPPPDTGSIVIHKVVQDECSGVNFTISVTGPQEGTPKMTSQTIECNNGGNEIVFEALLPGTYSIDESTGAGWHAVTSLPFQVTVTAGQTTFADDITNAPDPIGTGSLTITKVVTGACSGTEFTIYVNGPTESQEPASYQQTINCDNDGYPFVFDSLEPGTYTITESAGSGWHARTSLPAQVVITAGETTEFTITNSPDQTGIPTLSEWGMIIFSLLLASTAIWMMRRRRVA